jgi:SRSO17 transposase
VITLVHRLPQTEFSIAAQIETVTNWTAQLDQFVEQIRHRFARSETRIRVKQYLQGLLSTVERKNCWQLAQASGEQTPYGFQHLLGRAK